MHIDNKLQDLIKKYNKEWKAEKIVMSDVLTDRRLPTGSLLLDSAVGGGIPRGLFSMFWGPPKAGKSSMALHTVAMAQKEGLQCLWIDSEHRFNKDWASNLGVEPFPVARINEAEQLRDFLVETVQEKAVDLIVVDSISDLNSKKFYEEDNNSIGMRARAVNDLREKVNRVNTDTAIIFISQIRVQMKGNHTTIGPTGGNGLEHSMSLSIRFTTNAGDLDQPDSKDPNTIVGRYVHFLVTGTSISRPLATDKFYVSMNGQIDTVREVVELGLRFELIEKSGAWYNLAGSTQKIQGLDTIIEYLKDSPETYKELERGVLEKIG